jgi:general secretion pathway protein I
MNADKTRVLSISVHQRSSAANCASARRRKHERGFTLLEMIVATMIMAIAVVGLLGGITGATRNASRIRDYDRIVQLARLRMNDLLLDPSLTVNQAAGGHFDPAITGGLDTGWQATVANFEMPLNPVPGQSALDRIELRVWWMSGNDKRTFTLEAFRQRVLKPGDLAAGAPQ